MQRWEYKFIVRKYAVSGGPTYVWGHDEKDKRNAGELANDLGKDGWELVGMTTVPLGHGGHVHDGFRRSLA